MANCGFQSAAVLSTRAIQSRFVLLDPEHWDTTVGGVFKDTHSIVKTPCAVGPGGWEGVLHEGVDLQNGMPAIVNHLRIEYCWHTPPGAGGSPVWGEVFYELDGTRVNAMSQNEGYLQVIEKPVDGWTKIWFSKEADFGGLANIDCIDMEIFLLLGAIALALHL